MYTNKYSNIPTKFLVEIGQFSVEKEAMKGQEYL